MNFEKLKSRASGRKKLFRAVVEKINKMKGQDVDSLFNELHTKEFQEIDCNVCANPIPVKKILKA